MTSATLGCGTNRFTPIGPVVALRAAARSSASRSGLMYPAARKPRPPALATAAARAGVPGPPAIGAPTIGTSRSQNPSTIALPRHFPKLLRQRLFRLMWSENGCAIGLAEELARHRVDLVQADLIELLQRPVDTSVFSVVQFAATDAVHPRTGVFQAEHQPAP